MTDVKIVISDCDGVLTDGRVTYAPTTNAGYAEACAYSRRDGRAVERFREMGIAFAMVTRETVAGPHAARADKLLAMLWLQGPNETRLAIVMRIAAEYGYTLADVCYVGDSDTDRDALAAVKRAGGLAICPHDAHRSLYMRNSVAMRVDHDGGHGVLEDVADWLTPEDGE